MTLAGQGFIVGCLLIGAIAIVFDQRAIAERKALEQDTIGKVIVMVASGWSKWPALPQCEYDDKGRFLNRPCSYGGTDYYGTTITVPLEESIPEEPLPSWLWRISR